MSPHILMLLYISMPCFVYGQNIIAYGQNNQTAVKIFNCLPENAIILCAIYIRNATIFQLWKERFL